VSDAASTASSATTTPIPARVRRLRCHETILVMPILPKRVLRYEASRAADSDVPCATPMLLVARFFLPRFTRTAGSRAQRCHQAMGLRWNQAMRPRGGSLDGMSVFDIEIASLGGEAAELDRHRGKPALIVNVASECGLTPQYASLQRLAETCPALTVVGVPCNQFGGQEPGSAHDIAEFCSTTYGVTFPLTEKIEVNGPGRHPLYAALVDIADVDGYSGDIRWNFEKFLVDAEGAVVARFSPRTEPHAPELVAAIEKLTASTRDLDRG
jgi:glutathione peroxidase